MKNVSPQDSIFAGRVLTAMANRVSSELVSFSSWMVLGFGAILGLVLANIDTVSKFVAPNAFGLAVKLFLVAVIFNVLQRYMAAIVSASVTLAKEVEAMPVHPNADIAAFMHQIEDATLWPMKLMVRWSNRKIAAGDFAVGGRLNARLAQAQAWFVFAQLIAVVAAALVIANALQG